jgi:hypothetical protein
LGEVILGEMILGELTQTHPYIRNFTWSKKKYTFGGQKGKNKPSELKISVIVRHIHIHRSGILHGVRKNIVLGVKKAKISLCFCASCCL